VRCEGCEPVTWEQVRWPASGDGGRGSLLFGFQLVSHIGGSLGQDAVVDGEQGQFQPVADAGLVVDGAEIVLMTCSVVLSRLAISRFLHPWTMRATMRISLG